MLYKGLWLKISRVTQQRQTIFVIITPNVELLTIINNSNFSPTIEEKLFGIMPGSYDKTLLKKINYTILFMRFYIYTCKMQNKAIHLSTFVDSVNQIQNRTSFLIIK